MEDNILFPNLETERLILRRLTIQDVDEIFAIRSNKEIAEFLDRPLYISKEETLLFINKINDGIEKNGWIYWAVALKGNPKLIGTICIWNFSEDKLKAEVGFEMLPEFQGKGLMSEALKSVIEYGFNVLLLHSIEGEVDPENTKSIGLMERYGFKLVPAVRETDSEDVKDGRTVIYELKK